jgi:hypothetical protein
VTAVKRDSSKKQIQHFRCLKPVLGMPGAAEIYVRRESLAKYIGEENKRVVTAYLDEKQNRWKEGEEVHLTSRGYLRTDANDIEEDDLGDLPEITIAPFPWSIPPEVAGAAGVSVPLAQDLLQPEVDQWVKSFGLQRIDTARLEQLLRDRLQAKVNEQGLRTPEAALCLGMTEDSFRRLLDLRLPDLPLRRSDDGELRFVKPELDAFTHSYLPRFKTWSRRTSLLMEFFQNLEVRTGFRPAPQNCENEPGGNEIDPCGNLAEVVCANPACRSDGPPRKICVAHRELLRSRGSPSLCASCVRRVLHGDLQGQFDIAGSKERLLKDYPHA